MRLFSLLLALLGGFMASSESQAWTVRDLRRGDVLFAPRLAAQMPEPDLIVVAAVSASDGAGNGGARVAVVESDHTIGLHATLADLAQDSARRPLPMRTRTVEELQTAGYQHSSGDRTSVSAVLLPLREAIATDLGAFASGGARGWLALPVVAIARLGNIEHAVTESGRVLRMGLIEGFAMTSDARTAPMRPLPVVPVRRDQTTAQALARFLAEDARLTASAHRLAAGGLSYEGLSADLQRRLPILGTPTGPSLPTVWEGLDALAIANVGAASSENAARALCPSAVKSGP